MFAITILEKIREKKFSQGSVRVIKDGKWSRSKGQTNKYTIK